MPSLKQVNCSVELGPNNTKLKEYGARYEDGSVECFVVVPEAELPFTIHMNTRGYIASGLAMFVFIDGQYQCNRNKRCPTLPGASQAIEDYKIEFRVRQKEEKTPDGKFIGREWSFTELDVAKANEAPTLNDKQQRNVGTIEVVVLRCNYESQYLSHVQPVKSNQSTPVMTQSFHARTASAARQHAPSAARQHAPSVRASTAHKKASSAGMGGMSGLGGLFDGACDMNMDGAGDERPNQPNAGWDDTYGYYMGSQSVAPAYDPGAAVEHDPRAHRLTSANLNGQYDGIPQWGIDDRSTVHKHYGNWRIETLPNTPENDEVPDGTYGLDGHGYRGPPNIIINQYTQHPDEPKEDPYLGQQGDARNDYKARLREQGHSVSGVSPLASRRQPSQHQGPYPSYAPQREQYRQDGPSVRQGQDYPQNFSHGYNHAPGGPADHQDQIRHLQALKAQAQELERHLQARRQADGAHHAGPSPQGYMPREQQQQHHNQAPYNGHQNPAAFYRQPSVPPAGEMINPEYQRYFISNIGDDFFRLFGLNRLLLIDAVPYIPFLRSIPVNKLGTEHWLTLKADVDRFLAAGAFPDGTRFDRSKYIHNNAEGGKTSTKPEQSPHNTPGSWPEAKADNVNQKNNDGFWAGSNREKSNKTDSWPVANNSRRNTETNKSDPPAEAQKEVDPWDIPRPPSKANTWKERTPSIDLFPDDNQNANDNVWNGGDNQEKQADDPWSGDNQNNNAAGDWNTGNDQPDQGNDNWDNKPEDNANDTGWGNNNDNQPDQGNTGWGDSGGAGWDNGNDDKKSRAGDRGASNKQKSDHGGAAWDGTGNNDGGHVNSPPARSIHNYRKASLPRSERAISNANTADPRRLIKPYWADWRGTTQETAKDTHKPREAPRDVYNYPAPPKPTVPSKPKDASHGMQAGRGADYVHKTFRPVYLDEMDMPYAVFTFKYRSQERLEQIIGRKIDRDCESIVEEVERDQLLAMPKEKLVEHFLKLRSPTGGVRVEPHRRKDSNAHSQHDQHNSHGGAGWDGGSKKNEAHGSKKNEAQSAGAGWEGGSYKAPSAKSNTWGHNSNRKASAANDWEHKSHKAASNQQPPWDDTANNNNTGWHQTGEGNTGDKQWNGGNNSHKSRQHSVAKPSTAWTNDSFMGRRKRDPDEPAKHRSGHGAGSYGGGQRRESKAQQSAAGVTPDNGEGDFQPDNGGGDFKPDNGGGGFQPDMGGGNW